MKIVLGLFVLLNSAVKFDAFPITDSDDNLKLVILHNNDIHGRFDETGVNSDKCQKLEVENNRCFGGLARVASVVRDYRKRSESGEIPPVLFLNAGDTYTGTPWFAAYKDRIASDFLNLLKPDVISLGNHEFDEGLGSLGSFLREVHFPVLISNMKVTGEPELEAAPLKKSVVLEIAGRQVGLIGYLTLMTQQEVIGRGVEFLDEIISINEEADKLKAVGVNIIIALGHSGIERDKEIAAQCEDVDLVVGGHSHTFMYTGEAPSIEKSEGDYPTVITQSSGKRVPIVQAYAFSKYLGRLNVEFDGNGDLVAFDGDPILLDGDIPKDPELQKLLDEYRVGVEQVEANFIGSTTVLLDGVCRRHECNLGNFITDAMVDFCANNTEIDRCNETFIALLQGGGIRTSISYDKSNDGRFSLGDLQTVLPFNHRSEIVEITGAVLKEVLEHAVAKYTDGEKRGEFLQMSGIRVTYDMSKPTGSRVSEVEVQTENGFEELQAEKKYNVMINDYTALGGDGFEMLKHKTVVKTNVLDIDLLRDYLKENSPISPVVDGRITILNYKRA